MKKPLKTSIRMRGVRSPNGAFETKIWLDRTLLKLDKGLKIKANSLHGFG